MNKIECFKIRLLKYENETDIMDISKGQPIYEIGCLKPAFSYNPKQIEADPFLFVKNDTLYLFFEHKAFLDKGVLQMVFTKNLMDWSRPVTVVSEPFHLSFPWVFEHEGQVYMIPESEKDRSIRLYKACNNQLTKFELDTKLIEDTEETFISYCDTSIIQKGGLYYLFTTRQKSDHINTLEIYYSDKLKGPYCPHKLNPIVKSSKLGRNAGSILSIEGRTIRFAQDCTINYGDNVHVCRIDELSPMTYKESLILENLIPSSIRFYQAGGHQFNTVYFKGNWIVATDAKEYHSMKPYKVVRKILNIIK